MSSERQQSGLHWNASDLLGSSPVVGSSLELVVSVPEDKEVSGEVELGRWVGSAAGAQICACHRRLASSKVRSLLMQMCWLGALI